MAEFVLKDMVQKRGLADKFYIASAATSTEEIGNPVHRGTREKLREVGISTAGKTAIQMTHRDCADYDYLIYMDSWNLRNIRRIGGAAAEDKSFPLLGFAGEDRDIADPWYTGNFEATYSDVIRGCTAFLEYLRREGQL